MTNHPCPCSDVGVIRAWSTYAVYAVPSPPYTYEDIEYGTLTVRYAGEVLIQMDMDLAVLDFEGGAIVWPLTQEQTGLLPVGDRVRIYVDLVAKDGERSDIDVMEVDVVASGVDGVIPSEVDNE